MCRWGDGSVPAVTPKHLVSGPPAGRQRKDCLKSLVSVYVWEDERAAEVQIHVGAIQQAALSSIRGREARRKVRWGKSTGEWAAPSVPAALATHVSLGFDREIARAACSKYRNSSAPAWGGGDPTRIGTPATFHRGLMPAGLTRLLKRSGVSQTDRRHAANEMAGRLILDSWGVWRMYENKMRDYLSDNKLLEERVYTDRPEYKEPKMVAQRLKNQAAQVALEECFGRLAICRRATTTKTGEVVEAVVREYAQGRLKVSVGRRNYQVTDDMVLRHMRRNFIYPLPDPDWRRDRRTTSRRRQRAGHRARRAPRPLARATNRPNAAQARTEGRQAWTARRAVGSKTTGRRQVNMKLKVPGGASGWAPRGTSWSHGRRDRVATVKCQKRAAPSGTASRSSE